jgi:tetratricopeptide (TPR) repeat protein
MPASQQQTWESAMAAGQQAVQQGNYANVERIFLVALHIAEEFGLEDRRVAVSLSQLAQVYAGQGTYVEAESVYLQALKIYQTVHGEFHADVAATLNNLGVLHRMYGQYAQAEPLLTRALAIKEKLLGLDHPDVALSVVNLAQLCVVQGQPEKAEPLYRRALAIRKRALGPSHLARTIHEYLLRRPTRRPEPLGGVPILSPAGLFTVGLLDGLQVRLLRPYLREALAAFGLKRLATAFMNNPS